MDRHERVVPFFEKYIPFISTNYSPAPGVMDAEFVTNFDALHYHFPDYRRV